MKRSKMVFLVISLAAVAGVLLVLTSCTDEKMQAVFMVLFIFLIMALAFYISFLDMLAFYYRKLEKGIDDINLLKNMCKNAYIFAENLQEAEMRIREYKEQIKMEKNQCMIYIDEIKEYKRFCTKKQYKNLLQFQKVLDEI